MKEKVYTIIPEDWDYDCPHVGEIIKKYAKLGIYSPCQIEYLRDLCGAFTEKQIGYPLERIVTFWEEFKKSKWPSVKFTLCEGETWGDLKPIREF